MKSLGKYISGFCCTTVTLATTHREGMWANYDPEMNRPLLLLHFLSKLPFQFIFPNVTIPGHHKLGSLQPHLSKKVQLNFAKGNKERDQLLIWIHVGQKQAIFASKSLKINK